MTLPAKEIKNILLVRNDRFGEFLLNIPAFMAMRQSFHSARLVLAVNPYVEELAKCIDFVDKVIVWETTRHSFGQMVRFSNILRQEHIDLCIIFNPSKELNIISFLAGIPVRVGYDRKWGFLLNRKIQDKKHLGQKHEIDYNLELAGLVGVGIADKSLSLRIDTGLIRGLLRQAGIEGQRDLIAIHPWTSDSIKQWSVDKFKELATRLENELGNKVIIIGGIEEADKSQKYFSDFIDLTGKTTLVELAALLKKCKLLISGDSGPVHLASCVGTPVVAIFRNDIPGKSPVRWGPVSMRSSVVQKPNLQDITVEEVLNKIKIVIKI